MIKKPTKKNNKGIHTEDEYTANTFGKQDIRVIVKNIYQAVTVDHRVER